MQALVGAPEFVAVKIQQLIDITNVDQILWQIDFGAQAFNSSMNTLDLFASNVRPLLVEQKRYVEG